MTMEIQVFFSLDFSSCDKSIPITHGSIISDVSYEIGRRVAFLIFEAAKKNPLMLDKLKIIMLKNEIHPRNVACKITGIDIFDAKDIEWCLLTGFDNYRPYKDMYITDIRAGNVIYHIVGVSV